MTQQKEQILLEIIQIYEKLSDVKSNLFSYVVNEGQGTDDYFKVIENLEEKISKRKKQLEKGEY
ncbi:hypothetical protein OA165_00070 [Prochlorococcus sp. AH-736-A21]|nr:hypothetical protein [Prochlorococcus sp. AH-736-A21]|tara:strand:- start:301 stop:492 length:192 start_codon:yes stop_codon:yes gene_type:complete